MWEKFLKEPENEAEVYKKVAPDCIHFRQFAELNHKFWHRHLRGLCPILFKALMQIDLFYTSNSEVERGFCPFTRVSFKRYF